MDEWTSKEELAKNLNIKDIDNEMSKLIDNKFVEEKGGKYRINNQDGKGSSRISSFLNSLDTKYYPKIRHGYLHLKHKLEQKYDYPNEVKEMSKEVGYDLDNIDSSDLLEDAELFEIDEKTKWVLKMTNNQIFSRHLPYKKMVLDCDLEIDGKWFKGILMTNQTIWTYWGDNDGYCDRPLIFDTFGDTKIEEAFTKDCDIKKSTIGKLKIFICNFIDFINNPEVRIIRLERSQKNQERRIRQGKEPLPSSNKIKITGTLRTYYDKLDIGGNTLNYRFWVRGHFMRLWNKKKFHKLYKQLEGGKLPIGYYIDDKIRKDDKIIMIWKKPFIKGSGVLVSKKYELKKKRR